VARAEEPWSLYGIDFGADVSLSSRDGALHALVRASDKAGEIADLDLSSKLPHESLTQLLDLGPRAKQLPFEASLRVPGHALETLPPLLRPPDSAGTVSLDARATGTISEPKLNLAGQVLRYRPSDTRVAGLDLMVRASYEPSRGEISAEARSGEGHGEMQARWEGPITGVPAAIRSSQPSPIRGRARIAFDRLPLGDIPALALQEIRGAASGEVSVDGFGRDVRAAARIAVADLRIAQAKPMQLETSCTAQGGELHGRVRIRVPGGSADGEVRAGASWGDRVAPTIAVPVQARFEAQRFQLAGLLPLVRGAVSELDGKLDATMTGRFGGGPPVLAGTAKLDGGVVRIPAIGQRFHDIRARASLEHGDARVDDLTARGTSGKVKINARAHFDGLALQKAEAHLSIAKRDKIPVTTEGAEVGDAWGKVDASIENDVRSTRIDIRVPELHVLLPQGASHAVQELAPPEFIRTGVVQPDGNFVVVPIQPLEGDKPKQTHPTIITVKLQNKVWVERANQARVQLTGQLEVTPDTTTRINGEIRLKGGSLDVQGKEFEIERGTVTFSGDASNPEIVATAVWTSEVEYRVYADYTGTVEKGKLSLRSDPPLTQDQILSLILFGNPDGTMGTGSSDPAATAIGVAGGTATQGLNRMLSDFTQLDVTARIDTSSGSARPELVLRLTPRISARLTQAIGEPAPGEPPDRTFLTLGARIGGRWSVDTMIGDKGASSVDFNWRLRY
jgi:translocation and assembly module TamB